VSTNLEARTCRARALAAVELSLAEREGLPPAARALAEQGEELALQRVKIVAGRERAVAAALGHLASAVLAADPERGLELVERARAAGLGSVRVLVGRDPAALAGLPVVGRDALLASTVPVVTEDGLGWDPARGELWFAGEAAEAVLLELDTRRRELAAEADELAAREPGRASAFATETDERSQLPRRRSLPVAHLRGVRRARPALLERLHSRGRGDSTDAAHRRIGCSPPGDAARGAGVAAGRRSRRDRGTRGRAAEPQ
jgi:hypothetical protein